MRRSSGWVQICLAAFLIAGAQMEARAWQVLPSHDWTVVIGGTHMGVREWDYGSMPFVSAPGVPNHHTEVFFGDHSFQIRARIEIVAGAGAVWLVVLLVLAGSGVQKWRECRRDFSAGSGKVRGEVLE
ncbi:MAG: hypothetical protein HKN23_05980 [Verrucomicrobiales bacterium]|nr:hypothetical protein [Verrucomicrobiales bacterium]